MPTIDHHKVAVLKRGGVCAAGLPIKQREFPEHFPSVDHVEGYLTSFRRSVADSDTTAQNRDHVRAFVPLLEEGLPASHCPLGRLEQNIVQRLRRKGIEQWAGQQESTSRFVVHLPPRTLQLDSIQATTMRPSRGRS